MSYEQDIVKHHFEFIENKKILKASVNDQFDFSSFKKEILVNSKSRLSVDEIEKAKHNQDSLWEIIDDLDDRGIDSHLFMQDAFFMNAYELSCSLKSISPSKISSKLDFSEYRANRLAYHLEIFVGGYNLENGSKKVELLYSDFKKNEYKLEDAYFYNTAHNIYGLYDFIKLDSEKYEILQGVSLEKLIENYSFYNQKFNEYNAKRKSYITKIKLEM